MIKKIFFNAYFVVCLIFTVGFISGYLAKNPKPSKITTVTQTQTQTVQKQELQVQATVQKDSTLRQQTNYTEKFFNKQGILTRQVDYGKQEMLETNQNSQQHFTEVNDAKISSHSMTTITQLFSSSLYLGLNFSLSDFKNPSDIISKPEKINIMLEYRPFNRVNFFFESNYKFVSQVGFLIALN